MPLPKNKDLFFPLKCRTNSFGYFGLRKTDDRYTLHHKYDIIWKKHIPTTGVCKKGEAEALRLISGVVYTIHKYENAFAYNNYYIKEYVKNALPTWEANNRHAIYNFMLRCDDTYERFGCSANARARYNDTFDSECRWWDMYTVDAIKWAWDSLSDKADEKELRKREEKDLKQLKNTYKINTGKNFRRKNGSIMPPLKTLREWFFTQNMS